MLVRSTVVSLAFLLLLVPPIYGQASWERAKVPVNRVYLSGFAGVNLFQEKIEIGDEAIFGGRIGWTFAKHLALEGEVSWSPASYDTEEQSRRILLGSGGSPVVLNRGEDVGVDHFLFTGSVVLNLDFWGEDQWLVPFVQAGGGVTILDDDRDLEQHTTEPVFVFGGGLNVFVHSSVALRAEYKGQVASFDEKVPAASAGDTFFTSEVTGSITVYLPFSR